MTSSILQGIIQPAIADAPASFARGEQRGIARRDQGRTEESRRLTGQILSNALGGRLGQLGKDLSEIDPQAAVAVAQALKVPLSETERIKSMIGDVQVAATIFETVGPREAAQFAGEKAQLLAAREIEPTLYLELIDELSSGDPARMQAAGESLVALRDGFIELELSKDPRAAKAADRQPQINVLRKEISSITKPLRTVESAFKKIQKATDTAAGDLSLIFAFMRILDPNSTVREGEFATAEQTAGVPDRIVNAYNRALKGTRLGGAQRKDFLSQAEKLFSAERDAADVQIGNVLQQADQDQISRQRVFGGKRLNAFNERVARREPATPATTAPIAAPTAAPAATPGLPTGTKDNGDGTFTLPDGRVIRRKAGG